MDARVLKLYGTLETETGTNLWLQSFMALSQNLTTNLISSHKRPSVIVKESNEEICDE